ncbi:nonstructural protein [Capybara microvirus Cap1_SP_200]|nr:nonstructural protein [Capybara microvirus Cap1_SP_200]
MRTNVIGLFDLKSKSLVSINCTNAPVAQVSREFVLMCHDPNTNIGIFPDDFQLVKLGEFDELGKFYDNGEGVIISGSDAKLIVLNINPFEAEKNDSENA